MVWNTDGAETARASVLLSGAQRRDMAFMAAAGVISTGLILAIFLTARRPAVEHAASASSGRAASRVTIVSSTIAAEVTAPELQLSSRHDQAVRPARRQPAVRAALAAAPVQREKLSKKLARFVVGDGQYAVRPFPTVPGQDR